MNTFESFHEAFHVSSDMFDRIRSVFVHPIEERFPAKRHTDTNVSARSKPAVEWDDAVWCDVMWYYVCWLMDDGWWSEDENVFLCEWRRMIVKFNEQMSVCVFVLVCTVWRWMCCEKMYVLCEQVSISALRKKKRKQQKKEKEKNIYLDVLKENENNVTTFKEKWKVI